MRAAEVLIIGAGPAGAALALNLAPLRHVVLVERRAEILPRIGESLAPAARRLLADMRLLERFLAEGHAPWHGNRAVWGEPAPREVDFLRDPDGHGWHLDRARFEQWLRDTANARGADLLAPASVEQLEHDGQKWHGLLKTAAGTLEITADVLVDAGGRAAPIARKLGARAHVSDRLICAWLYGHEQRSSSQGLTYIEAVEDGWWYTAPLPERRRVLAFHTDADLPAAKAIRTRDELLRRAGATGELSALLADVGFIAAAEHGFTAAHSAILDPAARADWLAVGDAAISFDPISSQGLLNALFSGLAAAEALDRHLQGDTRALNAYSQIIRGIGDAYRRHLTFCYAAEQRWPEAAFWRRRHM